MILNETYNFKANDSKSHIFIPFEILELKDYLHIFIEYSPKEVKDTILTKRLFEEGREKYIPDKYNEIVDENKYLPITNLITISLVYENTYIGCSHRHNSQQQIIISPITSSSGYIPHEIMPGKWEACISLHSVSTHVEFKIKIISSENVQTIDYRRFELHTHTYHSDGAFSVEELCLQAKKESYDAIALTDHNTISGQDEVTSDLINKTIPVIPGIEWTTFYGHMLILNTKENYDWRKATRDNIDVLIKNIKSEHNAIGVAHPFFPGSPFCTGCYWDFNVIDWSLLDFIEVWSKPNPHKQFFNLIAFEFWTKLLNEGIKIPATCGRDWHRLDENPAITASTYLGINGSITSENTINAIKKGRTFVSVGPLIQLSISDGFYTYEIGDTINSGRYNISVDIVHEPLFSIDKVVIVESGAVLYKTEKTQFIFKVELGLCWFRVEVYGYCQNETKPSLIAFSSPVYVE